MTNHGKLKPFPPGVSGNPKGRPRGVIDKRMALRNRLGKDAAKIVERVIQSALNGDMDACKLILERLVPRLKSEHPPFSVELQGETFTERGFSVLQQVASGGLPPDVGSQIMSTLFNLAKLKENTDLDERLTKLERQILEQAK
jgi:hypothetical protein